QSCRRTLSSPASWSWRARRAIHLSLPFRIALPGVCASLQRLRTSSSSTSLRWLARTSLGRISPPDGTQSDCCYPALDRTSLPFLTHRTAPRHLAGWSMGDTHLVDRVVAKNLRLPCPGGERLRLNGEA